MTVTIDIGDGQIVEFPDVATAQNFMAQRQQPEPNPLGQRIKENLLGDDDDTTQNFGEKVGSFLNKAGEAMTFGLVGDEASAAVAGAIPGGQTYDERLAFERGQEEVFERDNPGAALTAEIGGGVTGALLPFGAIGTLGRGAGLLARTGSAVGTGAAMGGTYGFMEGEGGQDRADGLQSGAVIGGIAGAGSQMLGAGVQKVADALAGRKAINAAAQNAPSSEKLRAMGNQLYQQVDDAGVQLRPEAFDKARQGIVQRLTNETAYSPRPGGRTLTPNTAAVVGDMAQMSDEMAAASGQGLNPGLPFKEIDGLRRQAGAAAGNVTNRSDQAAGMQIIEGLDDMVARLSPDDVVAGDVQALQSALPKARETWQRMSKSQMLDDAISQSDNYLSGGASAVRNQFARILRNPKLSRGFSDAEKKVMQRVVSGSIPQQLVNYMGSGLGMMGQMGVGAATGGLPGMAMGAAGGALSRTAAETMTMRNAEIARAIMANGGLKQIPQATDASRRVTEALTRRIGSVTPQ